MLHAYRSSYNTVDLTSETPAAYRRLDSLAMLLLAESKHVSVCIVNNKLYIAASELYRDMPEEHALLSSMQNILTHLGRVARGEWLSTIERRALFGKICHSERLKSDLKIIESSIWNGVPNELFDKIITAVFERKDPKMSEFLSLYGSQAKIAMVIHAECYKIYRDFIKLQESLTTHKAQNTLLYEAFSSGNIEVLRQETVAGVHPEGQILSLIIRLVDEEKLEKDRLIDNQLYIGSSELNCLDCRMLIKSTNKLFEFLVGITIVTRGYRDARFDWQCPDGFSIEHSAHNSNEKWNKLAQMIYYKSRDLQERASTSSSEPFSDSEKQDDELPNPNKRRKKTAT